MNAWLLVIYIFAATGEVERIQFAGFRDRAACHRAGIAAAGRANNVGWDCHPTRTER